MTEEEKNYVFKNCLLGLPGSDESSTAEQILAALQTYKGIDRQQLKQNLESESIYSNHPFFPDLQKEFEKRLG